jgi:hypothetical protein
MSDPAADHPLTGGEARPTAQRSLRYAPLDSLAHGPTGDDRPQRTAKIWERFHVSMRVTVRERVEAYASGYAGNPVCFLEPAMVGVIAVVDVAYVRRPLGCSETFACVDFTHAVCAADGNARWRAGVDPKNLVPLAEPKRRYVRPPGAVRVVACPDADGWTGYTASDKAVLAFVTNQGVGIFGGAAALDRTRAALAAAGYALEMIAP